MLDHISFKQGNQQGANLFRLSARALACCKMVPSRATPEKFATKTTWGAEAENIFTRWLWRLALLLQPNHFLFVQNIANNSSHHFRQARIAQRDLVKGSCLRFNTCASQLEREFQQCTNRRCNYSYKCISATLECNNHTSDSIHPL